ncbi:hypothetical protein [Mycobacterium montefiorense]|uniref:hypothetical protein n=1 Tax=Mycobacterium montefiorense TaxID=154654 RepID=UPI0022327992|nr:hypothetical protein [Mycobacterium montefiorense]
MPALAAAAQCLARPDHFNDNCVGHRKPDKSFTKPVARNNFTIPRYPAKSWRRERGE